jgi:hypothetical protein
MLTQGNATQQRTAQQSFWNTFYAIADPFERLVWERQSTQKTDTYSRLGAAPMPEVWVGDREVKAAPEYTFTGTNQYYQASVRVDKELIRLQQWDEVGNLIASLGMKARALKPSLVTTLALNGISTVGDDGQFFFDTDHVDPGAEYTTSQSNDLGSAAATDTQPTDLEFATGIRACFDALYGFKDDRGDPMAPMDANPADFVAVVPPAYLSVARQVATASALTGPVGNDLQGQFTWRVNTFSTAVNRFDFYYAGSNHKPYIIQENGGIELTDEIDYHSGDTIYSATWYGRAIYGQWRTAVSYIYT